MSSSMKKSTEGSQLSNPAVAARPRQEDNLPTTAANTTAITRHTARSKSTSPKKIGATTSRKIRRHHRKHNKSQPASSQGSISCPSVMPASVTNVATCQHEEAQTAGQPDVPPCTVEGKGASAPEIQRKPVEVGPAPTTSSKALTDYALTAAPGQPRPQKQAHSQVADVYEALGTLALSPQKKSPRHGSLYPFPKLRNVRADPSSSENRPARAAALRNSRWPFDTKVVVVIVVLIMIILASTIFVYKTPKHQRQSSCPTADCEHHRNHIEDQLDKDVNPCDDFSAHVCGRWRPREGFLLSRSQLSDMFLSWLYKLPVTLEKGVIHFPVGKKVTAMFNSCIRQTGSHVPIMKDFMHAHGIFWPEEPDKPVVPAKTLFDLSFNWNAHLWFSVKILPTIPNKTPRRIFFEPNEIMLLWKDVIKQIPEAHFHDVFNGLYKIFSQKTNDTPEVEKISQTYKMLVDVFDTLVPSCPCKARIPKLFALRDIDSISPFPLGNQLVNMLNAVMGIDPPITMDDLVLVSDLSHFTNTLNLIKKVDAKALLRHLSWLFAQAYAPVADPTAALLVFYGSEHRGKNERPRFCAGQVEPSYKLLVAAMATVVHFSKNERRHMNEHLDAIVQVAVEKTGRSWLDNATKHVAVEKLKNVHTVVWPSDRFLTPEALEEVYKNFTNHAPSFTKFWIETRRSQRLLFGSEAAAEELLLGDNTHLPYVDYVHHLNRLSLSLGALAPPLYYAEGTKAMLYGGVLYLYAKALLSAIDDVGIKINARGEFVQTWLSDDVKDTYHQRTQGCLPGNVSIFPEVPAMEVAYEAFRRNVGENGTQLSEDLTEEKVFFITACLATCALTPADNVYGGDCNKAVMNFAPFARAFGCPLGSKMNPATKCSFYD
ncbi:endothelin-converting enzyme 2-like isoform X2 [Dermacentor albipictus]|uniref:endothelin-converting enzyme 2-like isoform X2 n=1 Tax=Dermacentor albipictus TaxID=60249 RepID=UPI0031FC55AC